MQFIGPILYPNLLLSNATEGLGVVNGRSFKSGSGFVSDSGDILRDFGMSVTCSTSVIFLCGSS